MYEALNLKWEDATKDDNGHVWARVCKECVKKYNIPDSILGDDNEGAEGSLCDVLGCQNEMNTYIDFED